MGLCIVVSDVCSNMHTSGLLLRDCNKDRPKGLLMSFLLHQVPQRGVACQTSSARYNGLTQSSIGACGDSGDTNASGASNVPFIFVRSFTLVLFQQQSGRLADSKI